MLDQLREWLNGSREYYKGVALYEIVGDNADFLSLAKKGKSDFTHKKLQDALLKICLQLKNEIIEPADKISQHAAPAAPENKPLYEAALKEATLLFKESMNDRATLFALANTEGFEDPNRPDLVAQRSKQAVDLVVKYNRVSELFDRAAYVKKHGRLPVDEADENEFDALPDHLVKDALNNARKAYNKLKSKEQTAERVALMQKHKKNIKKLELKWQSLRPDIKKKK